jgi:hypothetical protein
MWLSQPFNAPSQYEYTKLFGVEKYDPAPSKYYGWDAYYGWDVRYSDAAFIEVSAGVPWKLGEIARPTKVSSQWIRATPTVEGHYDRWCNKDKPPGDPDECYRTLADPPQTFKLDGDRDSWVGLAVNKVGKSTGWTKGEVIATNVWYLMENQRALKDQVHAHLEISPGDSGSPVFASVWGSWWLVGLAHANYYHPDLQDDVAVFSPVSGIRKDFERYGAVKTRDSLVLAH